MTWCCDEARKLSAELKVEYDEIVTEPRDEFTKQVKAEMGERVAVSYTPPEKYRTRIGEIVAAQRKISDGWCPVHTEVH